jgi:methylated-DNA-[protein]-cysteine S-methyltransferase
MACRRIGYGQTISYGQLAASVGAPGAARAVGTCMATNPLPLVVPCHRVIPAAGPPGFYSAPGGCRMKQRLLAMERAGQGGGCPVAPKGLRRARF